MNFTTKAKKARKESNVIKYSVFKPFVRLCATLWLISLLSFNLFAQVRDDSAAAQQYVQWIRQAIDEKRWHDAHAAVIRAGDFANVSSDISYLAALIHFNAGSGRVAVISALNNAIETNRWVLYNENTALLFKAEQLIKMRRYVPALECLDRVDRQENAAGNAQVRAESAMQRLLAYRGMALGKSATYDSVQALGQFRSLTLIAMDRFPRDPRPLRIFFEFARNRRPDPSDLPEGDMELLDLALRRLPFLIEFDADLAWMAAPFISDLEEARRLAGSYRANNTHPNPSSIPVALNLGLIDDNTAINELFVHSLLPDHLQKDVLVDTYNLLRSEEGRELFTQKLHSFSGFIIADDDSDGVSDSVAYYENGIVNSFSFDINQEDKFHLHIRFTSSGVPESAIIPFGLAEAAVKWERYPFVEWVGREHPITGNVYEYGFGPAGFSYAPLSFLEIGGSNNLSGLLFPVPAHQYIELTHHALLTSCSIIIRPSLEIEGAVETVYMNRGVILQSIETLNGQQVSVTEFERGWPVIQHIDLDLDGRMETIRRFREPSQADYETGWLWLNSRRFIASSESDWAGDGRHKTKEVYQLDGSVVYYFDMDGSGTWTYLETRNQR